VGSFKRLGVDYDVESIEMVRDPAAQVRDMGVPEEHLLGHAYHTYRLASADGSVGFEFQHNVCGRCAFGAGAGGCFVKPKLCCGRGTGRCCRGCCLGKCCRCG
jgi:hypothetical protein